MTGVAEKEKKNDNKDNQWSKNEKWYKKFWGLKIVKIGSDNSNEYGAGSCR